ncbi:hypothetical protein ACH5RR_003587 [Cinchona calisaya]|uniref:Uncharacterized protein n=1 Tax=Cinchona calisaya TaxID=153742 RepID=A0ABD3AVC4_9GENT
MVPQEKSHIEPMRPDACLITAKEMIRGARQIWVRFLPKCQGNKRDERKENGEEGRETDFNMRPTIELSFPKASRIIIADMKQGQIETGFEEGMSQLFIGMTSTEGPSTTSSFVLIEKRALNNWIEEYLSINREFQ